MVPFGELILPILLAAALVFLVSSLVWMVLPHHKKDWSKLPEEEGVFDALGDAGPGQYSLPHLASQEEFKDPEVQARFESGPTGFLVVSPRGVPKMGKNMAIWFVYALLASLAVALVAREALDPGTGYMEVFRVVGAIAWMAYGFSHAQESIWFGRPWRGFVKHLFDALLYGLVTAGAFAWLWPA